MNKPSEAPPQFTSPRERAFAIIGAGRVGTSIGMLLRRAGYRLAGFSTRSEASRRKASQWLDLPGSVGIDPLAQAEILVITVPDDLVESVCRQLVDAGTVGEETIVMHTAGSLGLEPLRPAAAAGAETLAVHVLQAIPDVASGIERIPGSWFGVTCADHLRSWAESFVSDLGGHVIWVPDERRPLYHAAAVIASNFLVTLASLVEETFDDTRPYLPLMRGTLENLESLGPREAITGPVVRGDSGTIRRHLEALAKEAPKVAEVYRALSTATLRYAERSGRVKPDVAQGLRDVLGAAASNEERR